MEIKKLLFEGEKLGKWSEYFLKVKFFLKLFKNIFYILKGEHGKLEEAELIMMEVEKVRSRKEDLIKIAES